MAAKGIGQRIMRGKPQAQPEFLTTINLNQRVPADHPLRGIKTRVDQVLAKLSPLFDELYAGEGRPSIPPEQLFKSRILMALYSVRSERLYCEQLAYNLLWLWFLPLAVPHPEEQDDARYNLETFLDSKLEK